VAQGHDAVHQHSDELQPTRSHCYD
jgi:hypothetical protein